jgi:hypothetical protein
MKIVYETNDGKKFDSRRDAEAHEAGATFDRLAGLSPAHIEAIPLTADEWKVASDGVKFLARLFERFGLAINSARREAGDVVRNGPPRGPRGSCKVAEANGAATAPAAAAGDASFFGPN